MLYTKNDSSSYIQQFKRKLTNFAEKAPLLMSFTTTPQGVQVINETTDEVFDFTWDFSIPVKLFIHGIKQVLINNGDYPEIVKTDITEKALTKDEQIELAISGTPVDQIPTTKVLTQKTLYRIDKCIVYKDIFIIENLENNEKYRYQMKKPSTLFLRKLRNKHLSPEDAGTLFFNNSDLLNKIELKDDNQGD